MMPSVKLPVRRVRANAVTGAAETAKATLEEHPQARWPGMVISQALGRRGLHHLLWAVPVVPVH